MLEFRSVLSIYSPNKGLTFWTVRCQSFACTIISTRGPYSRNNEAFSLANSSYIFFSIIMKYKECLRKLKVQPKWRKQGGGEADEVLTEEETKQKQLFK